MKIRLNRRKFIYNISLLAFFFGYFNKSFSGTQIESKLSTKVATLMRNSINDINYPYLLFDTKKEAIKWYKLMDRRLSHFVKNKYDRKVIIVNIHYEATRAGLNSQLIFALIEVESRFNKYAISIAGARGLMQVMPFWVNYIGKIEHNLFDIRTNLRYGCTILNYYLELENGDLIKGLARYNGSIGKTAYPNLVLNAYKRNWIY